ncbi:hypothetical protein DAPPUDRAFT_242072 [Daphnia pulex]|uniref:Uncharacterized protein n=1 Tax=Daphnia pulex TaxID=6669 RepID=E9GFT5_DAPPU|nr:hypothetical protein DAPPUDRAFT_242072 [Daphnia pulex]|eukprot:EFX81696.1 hypothetical protein DAPPUDRAFT_242072 [Daphnia pulex]
MSERLAGTSFSLLKYDNPVLVREPSDGNKRRVDELPQLQPASTGPAGGNTSRSIIATTPGPVPDPPSPPGGNKSRDAIRREAQDAINAILPPKEWTEDDQIWRQLVSSTPATRLDVLALQEQLDSRLKQRQAREIGICPIRRELYSQCFDELIRQVTVSCSERGFLLARVRDELNLTLLSYQTLYESSLAFGVRKALQAEIGRGEMEDQIEQLKHVEQNLECQKTELKVELERNAKRAQEDMDSLKEQHAQEVESLQQSNKQLKELLEGVLTGNK